MHVAHREELDRKENQSLKPIVRKLKSIKDAVDEGSKKYGESPVLYRHLQCASSSH